MRAKTIIVCADDFAQNIPISEGILELARAGRIHAISCMVNAPCWSEQSKNLHALPSSVALGLHLNLTTGMPLSPSGSAFSSVSDVIPRQGAGEAQGSAQHSAVPFNPLGKCLFLLYTHQLDLRLVEQEFVAQWDVFVAQVGRMPDFIDGHQHIHQYGAIRSIVARLCQRHGFHGFCRSSSNGLSDLLTWSGFPKPMLMWALGGDQLRRMLYRQQIPTNTSFRGFYPFKNSASYRHYFRKFLAQSKSGGLIMCHPGHASIDRTDPLYRSRVDEYDYLISDAYLSDLQEFDFG